MLYSSSTCINQIRRCSKSVGSENREAASSYVQRAGRHESCEDARPKRRDTLNHFGSAKSRIEDVDKVAETDLA